jgi:hypothetical protein
LETISGCSSYWTTNTWIHTRAASPIQQGYWFQVVDMQGKIGQVLLVKGVGEDHVLAQIVSSESSPSIDGRHAWILYIGPIQLTLISMRQRIKKVNAYWKKVREAIVCESPQLAVKIVCRRFSFKRFDVVAIQNRKRKDGLWSMNCWWE